MDIYLIQKAFPDTDMRYYQNVINFHKILFEFSENLDERYICFLSKNNNPSHIDLPNIGNVCLSRGYA